ncbi:hypothetical protein SELMODRAFT_84071 [Selaginella moellendorffii]|uniref:Transmembrane protein 14C n=1 Tax=Selaginella moellendorffii TaxID=88036 RepID=D8R330_SELML|nr:protein FATTY ACID EXPORT 7 [Selaginella moellendorffii]XP_002984431.1 protein FATTY ACID EXPORT 7 [Selaginella moellendorffii]EFJ14481.1 hypothetical protein SELMODRAFT_120111 [Selaginella moellendorffii]EFJ33207.1 hypothetical protein SELMODRAFT_84071 [Selaginella moellendorffii]|eukprot:XP_002965787.1 protein FATTY ACID EXPORT 7 [Selaginella moellendorffii]
MLLSQRLTLAYAAIVGVGGIIGYLKRRSAMSLVSGIVSSCLLVYVHTQLPVNPVVASSLGLGVSALLLVAMGNRFQKTGKLFPAGIVALLSFIMTGGYLHGIIHTRSHATYT